MSRWSVVLCLAALPAGALRLPPDAAAEPIHPGARAFAIRRADAPLAMDGVLWELGHPNLALRSVGAGGDRVNVAQAVSRHMASLGSPERRAVAGCNADFYDIGATNVPTGLFVIDGELLTLADGGTVCAVLADGTPRVAEFTCRLRVRRGDGTELPVTRLNGSRGPDHLVLYTARFGASTTANGFGVEVPLDVAGPLTPNGRLAATVAGPPVEGQPGLALGPRRMVLSAHGTRRDALRSLKPGEPVTLETTLRPELPVMQAAGGGPLLIRGGALVYRAKENEPRHPRTAVGFDGEHGLMLIVDGRRAGYSVGVTLPELADILASFGCREAMNLDGGGSSTCWVRGTVRNRPSDGRERGVPNSLALLDVGPLGPPAQLLLRPLGPLRMMPGARFEPRVTVTDGRLNPLEGDGVARIEVEGGVGTAADGTFVAGGQPGRGRLIARAGELQAAIDLTVVGDLARLAFSPSRLELLPGEPAEVIVSGEDAAGNEVLLSPDPPSWLVPAGLASLVDGRLTGGDEGRVGVALARLDGAAGELPIAIAGPRPVETFETDAGWAASVFPDSVQASAAPVAGVAGRGVRLTYQLGAEPATRAAYVRLDRELGEALGLRVRFRGGGQQAWLRLAVLDGNGMRDTYDLFQGELPGDWRTVTVALPKGLKQPITWQSVYAVATGATQATDGWVEWDELEVLQIPR